MAHAERPHREEIITKKAAGLILADLHEAWGVGSDEFRELLSQIELSLDDMRDHDVPPEDLSYEEVVEEEALAKVFEIVANANYNTMGAFAELRNSIQQLRKEAYQAGEKAGKAYDDANKMRQQLATPESEHPANGNRWAGI